MAMLCLYFLGLLLSVIGLFFIIINLNLLVIGYNFWQYFIFVCTHVESLLFILGIALLVLVYERG